MHWHGDVFDLFSQKAMLWHLHQKEGDQVPCAFEYTKGQDFWAYLRDDPAKEKIFQTAMKNIDIGRPLDCVGPNRLNASKIMKRSACP